jgi:hypothetical protein
MSLHHKILPGYGCSVSSDHLPLREANDKRECRTAKEDGTKF